MSYKDAKEAFVSHTTGSTLAEVLRTSSVTVASLTLYFAIRTRFPSSSRIFGAPGAQFLVEVGVLVVPILFGLTVGAERPLPLSLALLAAAFIVSFLPRYRVHYSPPRPSPSLPPQTQVSASRMAIPIPPLPSLTIYRANMMLLTVICILAVDFPVFPRSLAKCESWGISVMDLGVGSFVFSQGLVTAIPFLKNPSYASTPLSEKLVSTLWKVFPVLVLGLIRVVLVKGTDYPEHVSEYGVHWNFFITLGFLPLASVLLQPYMAMMPIPLLGLLITLGHQFVLSNSPLQEWVLSDQRVGLIGKNKEGITSFPGYLAIHVLGFAIGTLILPPSPSHFRRTHKRTKSDDSQSASSNPTYLSKKMPPPTAQRQLDKTAIELCAYVVVWWTLFAVARWLGGGRESVSRRLANTSYVLLTTAYNSLFLLCYMLIELVFSPLSPARATARRSPAPDGPQSLSTSNENRLTARVLTTDEAESGEYIPPKEPVQPPLEAPLLFEAMNKNGLAVFLVANVATGFVNMTFKTMYMGDASAMAVLLAYLFGICGLSWMCKGKRLLAM